MPIQNPDDTSGILTAVALYLGIMLAAFWLAMVIWAFRDARSRSRDAITPFIVGLMVLVLTVPGLLIYLFLRPRETLSEAYERSLEEEALLQAIEQKSTCPGCRQAVHEDWQACPNCHTRLKRPCVRCGKMLELTWDLCPYCASAQPGYAAEMAVSSPMAGTASGTVRGAHARPADLYTGETPGYENAGRRGRGRKAESIEFIDEEL